eukprot:gene10960-17071_t
MELLNSLFRRTPPAPHPGCALLTDASPTDAPPACGRVALWKHQRAMLRRCRCIEAYGRKLRVTRKNEATLARVSGENNNNKTSAEEIAVGVMNDPPGCGKTFVMLALMAAESDSVNLVVVPPNLHHQWVEAAARYLPPSFPRTTIVEYSQTVMLYTNRTEIFKKNRLIITTTTFVDAVSGALSRFPPLDHVIVDEVDTAISSFHLIPPCHRMWFLSASFRPSELDHLGGILNFSTSGSGADDIGGLVCRCEHAFMTQCHKQQGVEVLPATTELVAVPDGDIGLFTGVVDATTMTLLNTLDLEGAKARLLDMYKCDKVASVRALAHLYLQDLDRRAGVPGVPPKTRKSLLRKADILRERLSVGPRLEQAGIRFVNLQGGTVCRNEDALHAFRNDPAVRVLLINSVKDGCGLNLEFTTHILLLHRTSDALVDQVVGRAQRPGRTSSLKITCVFHDNEVVDDAKSSPHCLHSGSESEGEGEGELPQLSDSGPNCFE